jgi:hypothetical protein
LWLSGQPAFLTGFRGEGTEVVVYARLATEDDVVVFAEILRGVRPSVTQQARPELSLQQIGGERCGLKVMVLITF